MVYINLSQKPEWLYKLSPLGKVPCIQFNDDAEESLYESLIIAEYLDEAYPETRKLLPIKPFDKAKDKLLIERFNEVITMMYKVLYNNVII